MAFTRRETGLITSIPVIQDQNQGSQNSLETSSRNNLSASSYSPLRISTKRDKLSPQPYKIDFKRSRSQESSNILCRENYTQRVNIKEAETARQQDVQGGKPNLVTIHERFSR